MRRVLVIITNPQQASQRLWIEAIRPLMPPRGVELDVRVRPKGWLARRALLRRAGEYDAVLLFRKLLDPSDARLLRRCARRIFYALDDAVMFHAHAVGAFSQWRTNRRFEATAAVVDHVVAGNEYLADFFRRRGRSVTVLPTCVDPAHYRVKDAAAAGSAAAASAGAASGTGDAADDGVSLVWIGSSSTLPYLAEQLPSIRAAAARVPGLRLITIADRTVEDAGVPVEHVPWSADTEADALASCDIGIAPTPDDRWTRGKCGFKLIQYMAAGLPAIASPVGANAEIVVPGETGLLATTSREWVEAIARLAGNPQLRRHMGRAGRQRVEREYSVIRAADTWARLLAE